MLLRVVILLALFILVIATYLLWRRPPRRLQGGRLDLAELQVRGPAIVQFTTRYCAPCRAVAPRLHEAAVEEGVAYEQVDVGARPEIARTYGIRSVPTIVVAAADGRILKVWTGVPANGEVSEVARRARAGG